MRFRVLLALICSAVYSCLSGSDTVAAEARTLSLRDCLDLALTRNLDVQIQRLTADIAGYGLRATYGDYVPTFAFSGRHSFLDEPGNDDPKKLNPYLPYHEAQNSAGPQLTGRLPFGLSYDFGAVAGEANVVTDFRPTPENALLFPPTGIRETNNAFAEAGVLLRQHLLKDFWIDQYWQKLLLRRRDLKISEAAWRFQIMRTVLAVELGYDDLVLARENVRVQEKALELKQQFLAETRRRVQVGDLPPLDAEQAETQLQNTLTSLTAAREAYLVQQTLLKDLVSDNFRDWVEIELHPADPLFAIPLSINLSESFASAVKNRPDLAEARLAVEKQGVIVRYRQNQLFPSLDLVGHYGGVGIQTNLSSSISDALSFRNPQYFYGAVISFPLDNVAERNEYRASKAARRVAELELKRAEQKILVDVEGWTERVRSRFAQVDSTHKARGYAESALAAEEKKLQNGLSTSFVVLQLQEVLTAARMSEVVALAEYNKAQAQLAFAEGSTLERHHMSVEVK